MNGLNASDWLQVGDMFCSQRAFEQAVYAYRSALISDPDCEPAFVNLGAFLPRLGRNNEAKMFLHEALRRNPNNPGTLTALAQLAIDEAQFREAENLLVRAQRIDPAFAPAPRMLGFVYQCLASWQPALEAYEMAARLNPLDMEVRTWAAMIRMTMGDWERGFQEYDARLTYQAVCPQNGKPIWCGEDLKGKTILLCTEQGVGDAIQFVRYAKVLDDMGARVWVRCRAQLEDLFDLADGVCVAVSNEIDPPDRYDYHVPAMSLPRLLKNTPTTVPGEVPYIHVGAPRSDGGIPRVGFCWAGNPEHVNDKYRSIHDRVLVRDLCDPLGIRGYSLQVGPANRYAPSWLGQSPQGWLETARFINDLELVITVDTAVAHLAGALGKPVWILLSVNPDWRWGTAGDTTPWYPTAKIFRQQALGDWSSVIQRVRAELDVFVKTREA